VDLSKRILLLYGSVVRDVQLRKLRRLRSMADVRSLGRRTRSGSDEHVNRGGVVRIRERVSRLLSSWQRSKKPRSSRCVERHRTVHVCRGIVLLSRRVVARILGRCLFYGHLSKYLLHSTQPLDRQTDHTVYLAMTLNRRRTSEEPSTALRPQRSDGSFVCANSSDRLLVVSECGGSRDVI
jgi:hypothetical protein